MARVTHVQKAQQRYKTVPVLDPETGEPQRTLVMNKRTGEQKKTKHGKAVFMTVTVADKTQPLPLLSCDFPGCQISGGKIAIGSSYKHITPKSGPYGGTQKNRHAEHPSWNIWEYSYSLAARVAQAQNDMEATIEGLESVDDFESVKDDLAQQAQELLDEKEESLEAMPEGLADGSQVEEQRDALQEWVDEIENTDEPEQPEPESETRYFVINKDGSGDVFEETPEGWETEEEAQAELDAFLEDNQTGDKAEDFEVVEREHTPEEPTEEQIDEWLDEARDALRDAVNSAQV